MRILLLEFFSSGGIYADTESARNDHERSTLVDEGWQMLQALIQDAVRSDGLYIDVLLDKACDHQRDDVFSLANVSCYPISNADQFRQQLSRLAVLADYVIAVAPETGNLLGQLAEQLRKYGANVLLPSAEQISWSSSKFQTYQKLTEHKVPTPEILNLKELALLSEDALVVVKPEFGAGCIDTNVLTASELSLVVPKSDTLIQPYHSGIDVSVSVIMGAAPVIMQPLYQQIKIVDQSLKFMGVENDVATQHAARATHLAQRCIPLFTGATGWIGIDMVIGESPTDDMVIEINPRLTTSFCTLHKRSDASLVGKMIDNAAGRELR
tara:strand:+ start:979 stop:1953 length:975 start_codon:yes stop_codon:yes gene_type:complete